MSEDKLIQINLQIPVSELAEVTALVEQVRQLLTADRRTPVSHSELTANTSFDEARFQELAGAAASMAPIANPTQPDSGDISFAAVPAANSAEALAFTDMEFPVLQRDPTQQPVQASTPPTAAGNDIAHTIPEAAVENESSLKRLDKFPDTGNQVEGPLISAGEDIAAPPAVDATVSSNVSTFMPERQRDAEQLVTAGPAPLTAEAVSLAFRRDDRRYDNGFPLY